MIKIIRSNGKLATVVPGIGKHEEGLLAALAAAYSALRSYQHGNASLYLARDVADAIERELEFAELLT